MATTKNTKATEVEETEAEQTVKQVINEGIERVVAATGIDVQKSRYKAMRAIAFEAFAQAIEAGSFDELVDAAIANIDELPSGWEVERAAKATPAPKAAKPAAKTPAKAPAKASTAKATPRRRPTR